MGTHITDWQCTDPDQYQFGRRLGTREFEFREFDHFSIFPAEVDTIEEAEAMTDNWTEMVVNLDDYSDEEKEDVSKAYYGSLDELKEQNGDAWEWVLAECIFEQESGLY